MAFAPQAFNRSQNLSRRERRSAFAQAFALQARNAGVCGADPLDLGDGRTRTRATWLAAAELTGRVVLVDSEPNASLLRSAANIPNLSVVRVDTISTYEVLFANTLVSRRRAERVSRNADLDHGPFSSVVGTGGD